MKSKTNIWRNLNQKCPTFFNLKFSVKTKGRIRNRQINSDP